MTASGRHLQGALHTLLTFHVTEVDVEMVLMLVKLLTRVDNGRLVAVVTVHKTDDVRQCLHAIDLQLVHDSRFTDILLGDNETLELLCPRPNGDGQCTANRLQTPVES